MYKLASAFVLAIGGLLSTLPVPAFAEPPQFDLSPTSCAKLYKTVQEAKTGGALAGLTAGVGISRANNPRDFPFFQNSNAMEIDWNARINTLRERFDGGDAAWDVGTNTAFAPLLSPTDPRAGFEPVQPDPQTGRPTAPATPAMGEHLRQCDTVNSFGPVFWYGRPNARTCAVMLFMVGLDTPQHRPRAIAEAENAITAYMAERGLDNRDREIRTVVSLAQDRYQRLPSNPSDAARVRREVQFCRLDFGVEG